MIKSPLRYPGGKSRVAKFLVQLLPEFEEFREPFWGGGSVFLTLKQKYWVNDLYHELFLFWYCLQNDPAGLITQIEEWRANMPTGKELFYYLKK